MVTNQLPRSVSRALIPTNSDQFNLHSTKDSKGFRNQLNDFREALDPNGVMAKMDFYAKPHHTPIAIKKMLHWSPIPVLDVASFVLSHLVLNDSATIMTLSWAVD